MCDPTCPLWTVPLPGRKREMVRKEQRWGKKGRSPTTEFAFISNMFEWVVTCLRCPTPKTYSLRHKFEQIFHDLTVSLRSTASSAHRTHGCVTPALRQWFMSVAVLLLIGADLPLQVPKPRSAQSRDCVVPRLLQLVSNHSINWPWFFSCKYCDSAVPLWDPRKQETFLI